MRHVALDGFKAAHYEQEGFYFCFIALSWWRIREIFVLVMDFCALVLPAHSTPEGDTANNIAFRCYQVIIYCISDKITRAVCMLELKKFGFPDFLYCTFPTEQHNTALVQPVGCDGKLH